MTSEAPHAKGKKVIIATNKIDHFNEPEKSSTTVKRMHPSGRFHATDAGSHVKRIESPATKCSINIFSETPNATLKRTHSTVINFLRAASTHDHPSLGRKTVKDSPRSTLDFKTMFEPTPTAQTRAPPTAKQYMPNQMLVHHEEPLPRRPVSPRRMDNSSRVLDPSLQEAAVPPQMRRSASPTFSSTIGSVINGTQAIAQPRPHFRRVTPAVFATPQESSAKPHVPTLRHPVQVPLRSQIFCPAAGQCFADFKPSSWGEPSPHSSALQKARIATAATATPVSESRRAQTPDRYGRRQFSTPSAAGEQPPRASSVERSGRKFFDNLDRNRSTFSLA